MRKINNLLFIKTKRSVAFALLISSLVILAISAFGQTTNRRGAIFGTPTGKAAAPSVPLPTPTFSEKFNGNPTCANIAARYPNDNVTDPNGLRLNFGGIYSDLFYFNTYTSAEGGVILEGTTPSTPLGYIQVTTAGNDAITSFSSQKPITAVILKVGNTAYVYYYDIPGFGYTLTGGNLEPGDNRGTSHIIFCFEQPLNPSAAGSNIGGRVTRADGIGLGGVSVVLQNPLTGERRTTISSPFGYYYFEDIPTGESYVVSVASRNYNFLVSSRFFTLFDSVSDIDFVASP